MGWINVAVQALVTLVKGLWGRSEPERTVVVHPEQEVETDDGKTDKERVEDLGL